MVLNKLTLASSWSHTGVLEIGQIFSVVLETSHKIICDEINFQQSFKIEAVHLSKGGLTKLFRTAIFVVHHDSCFNYIARSVLTYFSKIMRLSCCILSSCLCSPCIRVQRMFLLNNFYLYSQIKFLLPPNKAI